MYDFDWSPIPRVLPFLWEGMKTTLEITATATGVGIAFGTALAILPLSYAFDPSMSPTLTWAFAWNAFAGVVPFDSLKPVKKFTDRKTAVSRIWKAIQALTPTPAQQAADAAPTTQLAAAVSERLKALGGLFEKWNMLRTKDLAALNAALKAAGLPEIGG